MNSIGINEKSVVGVAAQLAIIDPRSWRPLLADQLSVSARACLDFLHDRHIGITPFLAEELQKFNSNGIGCWAAAADRLAEVFDIHEGGGVVTTKLWMQVPLYLLTARLAAPVLRRACERIGLTICFGNQNLSKQIDGLDRRAYSDYDIAIRQEVKALLAKSDNMGMSFWLSTAEALYAGIVRRVGQEVDTTTHGRAVGLVEIDLPFLTLLRRLEPDFSRQPRRQLPTAVRTFRSKRFRSGFKPKEGGVSGVRVSRSSADYPDLLNCEYLNPRALLADKLVNGSFLVRSRPPYRSTSRHALIVGALLAPASNGERRLAKAAWLQAAFRTAVRLANSGLEDSELRWIECIEGTGVRYLRANLMSAPRFTDDIWDLTTSQMMRFYRMSMWRPALSDRLTGRTLVVEKSTDEGLEGGLAELHGPWLRAAYNESWRAGAMPGSAVSVDEFSSVHLQLFLPDPSTETTIHTPNWHSQRSRFLSFLDFQSHVRRSVDLCLIPNRPSAQALRLWANGSRNPTEIGLVELNDQAELRHRYADMIGWMVHSNLVAVMESGRNV